MSKAGNDWTDDELGIIADTMDRPISEVMTQMPRSRYAISCKRVQLRKGWTRKAANSWTAEEDEILRQLGPQLSSSALLRHLPGRTTYAIQYRVQVLGIKRQPGQHHNPFAVGHRPLIAKTCRKCGLLLPSGWFAFKKLSSGNIWWPYCRKCDSREGVRQHQRNPLRSNAHSRAYQAKAQALTLPRASRNGYPYTQSDHQVLADASLTNLAKALKLNRSFKAASSAVWSNGYKSHTALGDPLRDRWIIENPNLPAVQAITNEILHHMTAAERRELGWDFTDLDIAS